jgi:uncharacterized protein YbjQ (UPF0145 family)
MPWWVTLLVWVFILIPLVAAAVAFVVGPIIERRHLADLDEREAAVAGIPTHDLPHPVGAHDRVRPVLVTGSVVMGVDAWRTFVLALVNLVGGDAPQVDRVMQRARREALVRLKEEAQAVGAVEVVNLRMDTSTISSRQGNSGKGTGEILCHATALVVG